MTKRKMLYIGFSTMFLLIPAFTAQAVGPFGFTGQQPPAPNMVQFTSPGAIIETLTPFTDGSTLSAGDRPNAARVLMYQQLAGLAKGTMMFEPGTNGTTGMIPVPAGTPPQLDPAISWILAQAGVMKVTDGQGVQVWP
jgi:hypothetical protein